MSTLERHRPLAAVELRVARGVDLNGKAVRVGVQLVSSEFIQKANFGASFVTASLAGARFAMEGIAPVGVVLATTSSSLLVAGFLARTERFELLARWMLSMCGLLGIAAMSIVEGQLASEALFWLPFIPLVAILAVSRAAGVLAALLASILAAGLVALAGPEPATILQAFGLVGAVVFGAFVGLAYASVRDREAARLNEALRAAQAASQAKSEFLASMSHELRTPLNAIIGFSGVIVRGKSTGKRTPEVLAERIRHNGEHLLDLINDILDISKIEARKLEVDDEAFDVCEVIRTCIRSLEPLAREKGITVESCDANIEASLRGDALRVKQVLTNLLSNAVKFSPAGACVDVTVLRSGDGRALRLDVTDTGRGIAPDDVTAAFEMFRQVDQTHARTENGTGIGLALSRRLCELMGYRLEVVSTVGEGSTFSIYFDDEAPQLTAFEARISDATPIDF